MGPLEKIEDIGHLRFIEHGSKPITAVYVDADTVSVDTPKDLETVRKVISVRLKS